MSTLGIAVITIAAVAVVLAVGFLALVGYCGAILAQDDDELEGEL